MSPGTGCVVGGGDAVAEPGELPFEHRDVVAGQVVADQVHGQVPALRPLAGPPDPGGDDRRVTRPDHTVGLEPVQRGPHGALGQVGVADQGAHARECSGTVRAGMIGQPDQHGLARAVPLTATVAGDRGKVQRPRDRLNTHPPVTLPVYCVDPEQIARRSSRYGRADALPRLQGARDHGLAGNPACGWERSGDEVGEATGCSHHGPHPWCFRGVRGTSGEQDRRAGTPAHCCSRSGPGFRQTAGLSKTVG